MTDKQKQALKQLRGLSAEEVVKCLEEMENDKNHVIDYEEQYYYIDCKGIPSYDNYHAQPYNNDISITKCHRTEDEQMNYIKHLRLRMQIVNRIRELNNGWKPNPYDDEIMYYIYFDGNSNNLYASFKKNNVVLPLDMYLKSRKIAEQLIEELREEIIEYLTYQNWDWVQLPPEEVK